MGAEQQYIDLFEQCAQLIDSGSAPSLNAPRRRAMQAFAAQGFPTLRQEEARYTDVPALFAPDYGLNLRRTLVPTSAGWERAMSLRLPASTPSGSCCAAAGEAEWKMSLTTR